MFCSQWRSIEEEIYGKIDVIGLAVVCGCSPTETALFKQGCGHILSVTSIGGVVTFPTVGLYQAAKHAVEGMAETLASEVGQFGTKVTIVEPGTFATEFTPVSSQSAQCPNMTTFALVCTLDLHLICMAILQRPEAPFKVVDDEDPLLRLLLGSTSLPINRKVYADLLATWVDVSNAAQNNNSKVKS